MTPQRQRDPAAEGLNVAIVNQVPSRCLAELATALRERGHRVTLLAGAAGTAAIGDVVVVPLCDYDTRTYLSRVWSWVAFTFQAAVHLSRLSADTVVVACSNPPTMPFIAAAVAVFRRFAVVPRVLDVYPDVLWAVPFPGRRFVAWLNRAVNRWTYARCSAVSTLGATMAETLSAYVARSRIRIIPEWIPQAGDHDEDASAEHVAPGPAAVMTVVAAGNVGATHDIAPLFTAADMLRAEPVRFVVSVKDSARLSSALPDTGKLQLRDRLPDDDYAQLLDSADVAFVSQRAPAEQSSFPSRVPTYLRHGLAVVAAVGRPSDLAALLDRHACGIVVPPSAGAQGVADALRALCCDREAREQMRHAARRAAQGFTRAEWLPAFVAVVEETGARHRHAAGTAEHG